MRRLSLTATVAVVMLAANASASSAATETDVLNSQGLSASAGFESFEGCVETGAEITATDGRVSFNGGPSVSSGTEVSFIGYDSCSGEYLREAYGMAPLTPSAFLVTQPLTSASLNTTIDVYDNISSTSIPVAIDVSWTGTAGTVSGTSTLRQIGPGFVFTEHTVGSSRNAIATGTISDGTTDFTPEPSQFANIDSDKQGWVQITHG